MEETFKVNCVRRQVRHFWHILQDEFGNMPVMRDFKIGYGMGAKDFETANCVRVMLGETESEAQQVLELKM